MIEISQTKFTGIVWQLRYEALASLASMLAFFFCLHLLCPPLSGTFSLGPGNEARQFQGGFSFSGAGATAYIDGTIRLPRIYPTLFRIVPDDCLTSLEVNGVAVSAGLPVCSYRKGALFDLKDYLHRGENSIRAIVKNTGGAGGLRLEPCFGDWRIMGLLFASLSAVFVCAIRALRRLGALHDPLILVLIIGALIRIAYFIGTPSDVRAHDFMGHLAYVWYVLSHFTIPPAQQGWEFYQPPLYYFCVALVLSPFKLLGFDNWVLLKIAQCASLVLSCASLALAVWISKLLWIGPGASRCRLAFVTTLGVLPGIVFSASRISNDTLVEFLAFAFFALLLRWWRFGSPRAWYGAVIVLGLGVLTKSNFLPYIGIAGLTLLSRPRGEAREASIAALLIRSGFILVIMTSWYFLYRFGFEGEKHLVGNIANLNRKLFIPLNVTNFLKVNPLAVIRDPFNDPWTEASGRSYLWEYLIKSAFTGEWRFHGRVQALIAALQVINFFVFLPLALLMLMRDVARLRNAPLWSSALIPVASMICIVILHPVAVLQDFRHVHIMVIPITFYVVSGIDLLPGWIRKVGWWMVGSFCVLCVLALGEILLS